MMNYEKKNEELEKSSVAGKMPAASSEERRGSGVNERAGSQQPAAKQAISDLRLAIRKAKAPASSQQRGRQTADQASQQPAAKQAISDSRLAIKNQQPAASPPVSQSANQPTANQPTANSEEQRAGVVTSEPAANSGRKPSEPSAKIIIQFAASGNRQGINAAVAKAQRAGIAAYAQAGPVKEGGTQIWRARATAQSAEQAKSYMQKLNSLGHESFIVRR